MTKSVYIIGGGCSVEDIQKEKLRGKDIIAINKAILDFPKAKYFITMDHSILKKFDLQRKALKESPVVKFFIANLCPEYMTEKDGKFVDTRWNIVYQLNLFDVIIKSRQVDRLELKFNDFGNGMNSGFCALQLAIILGYTEIYLMGYDFTAFAKTHYHGGYGESVEAFNKKLENYYQIFRKAVLTFRLENEHIKIYNCSLVSKLNDVLPYKEI